MCKNYCEKKEGKIKKGNYSDGRGYSGWYTTRYNKKVFLRSLGEYIFAKKLDYYNIPFLTEKMTYYIENGKYKPDFFIYDNDFKRLIKIIELKYNNSDIKRYIGYKKYFNNINIEYEIEFHMDKRKNYEFVTIEQMNTWKENSVTSDIILNRNKNPMFGMKHSNNTKKKIGKKTKQYMSDPDIKEKHRKSLKSFWSSDKANIIKDKYRKLRMKESIERRKKQDEENPIIIMKCIYCNVEFKARKFSGKKTCSNSCSQKYNWKIGKNKYNGDGKKSYKTKIINLVKKIENNITEDNFTGLVNEYKNNNVIPLNFGLSLNTINKYFGNFNNFIQEINNG